MKTIILTVLSCGFLAACGADGDPKPPRVSGETAVSLNSNSGMSTSTSIGIHFGG
ncbi:hypothetical protein EDD53_1945 [Pacificibacter maritimus]|uniref:Argininosuccinate lyase n=1 Tax=Pacificibacter maritimus TaxID=762213 RepID=A0A3N4UCT0_9RHOB|nr:hypothetical protein [Pacificibacter maritimus]RPE66245.1 hypothetical protein EDD53_1945 [Pacificibacter maritimus]